MISKLPKQKGFTLIELMVAIAIVAILAVVGLAIYGNVQKQARDARRTQDIEAIANALEAKKNPGDVYYLSLTGADFSAGSVPTDPKPTVSNYCIWGTATVPPAAPFSTAMITTNWSNFVTCGGVGAATYGGPFASGMPTAGSLTSWTICAKLEANGRVICVQSKL